MRQNFYKSEYSKHICIVGLALVSFFVISVVHTFVYADTVDDLKNKIKDTNTEIQKLEEEIKLYEKSLDKTATQAKSLKNELDALNLSKKKLETELKLTEKNLTTTTKTIGTLKTQISDTETSIDEKKFTIALSMRDLRLADDLSLVERFLLDQSFDSVTEYFDQYEKINTKIVDSISNLEDLQVNLSHKKTEQEKKEDELKKLKNNLSGQQKAVIDTTKQKDKLLLDTKNKESEYARILAEKIQLRAEFEKELFAYESELQIAIDPSKLPKKGAVLSWPVANVFITQQFGKTGSSGRLYASGTHNGIDLRATDGTKVLAALSGTVQATGNTDLKKNCYSYGKWILIKHPNGLSTLYAHLSSVSVSPGDSVTTGDVIAYSGHTGYVTGPHLHLTLLATEGVRVTQIPTATNCQGVTIPIGDPKAFLDPLLYLPSL